MPNDAPKKCPSVCPELNWGTSLLCGYNNIDPVKNWILVPGPNCPLRKEAKGEK